MDRNRIRMQLPRWRQQVVRKWTVLKESFWAALGYVRWFAYGAEIVLLLVLVTLYVSSFRLASSGMDSGLSEIVSLIVIHIWVDDPAALTPAEYQLSVGIAVSLCIAINTVMLGVVVPLAAVAGFYRDARIVEASRADKEDQGRDTLARLLKNADKAIIFAGSFDWICNHDRMLQIVSDLARRRSVCLVSHRSLADVAKSFATEAQLWTNIKDQIVSDRPQKILLTVAYYSDGSRACCTMAKSSDNPDVNIVIRETKVAARQITRIIHQLCGGFEAISDEARTLADARKASAP